MFLRQLVRSTPHTPSELSSFRNKPPDCTVSAVRKPCSFLSFSLVRRLRQKKLYSEVALEQPRLAHKRRTIKNEWMNEEPIFIVNTPPTDQNPTCWDDFSPVNITSGPKKRRRGQWRKSSAAGGQTWSHSRNQPLRSYETSGTLGQGGDPLSEKGMATSRLLTSHGCGEDGTK